jgi:hypothetical protein
MVIVFLILVGSTQPTGFAYTALRPGGTTLIDHSVKFVITLSLANRAEGETPSLIRLLLNCQSCLLRYITSLCTGKDVTLAAQIGWNRPKTRCVEIIQPWYHSSEMTDNGTWLSKR